MSAGQISGERQSYGPHSVTMIDDRSRIATVGVNAPGTANSAWCSRAPAWSRDGRIYFQSFRPSTGGDVELFVMAADGSELERLTTSGGEDGGPRLR